MSEQTSDCAQAKKQDEAQRVLMDRLKTAKKQNQGSQLNKGIGFGETLRRKKITDQPRPMTADATQKSLLTQSSHRAFRKTKAHMESSNKQ